MYRQIHRHDRLERRSIGWPRAGRRVNPDGHPRRLVWMYERGVKRVWMGQIKLSLTDYLLAPGAMLSVLTNADDYGDEPDRSLLDRLRDTIVFARAQPLDVYLGSRHL